MQKQKTKSTGNNEQNYHMIDNVLNNEAEKKEQEQTKGRILIKEKLAKKRRS